MSEDNIRDVVFDALFDEYGKGPKWGGEGGVIDLKLFVTSPETRRHPDGWPCLH